MRPPAGEVTAKVEHLTKRYGNVKCWKMLIFKCSAGERVAFVGQNGRVKPPSPKSLSDKNLIGSYPRPQCDGRLLRARSGRDTGSTITLFGKRWNKTVRRICAPKSASGAFRSAARTSTKRFRLSVAENAHDWPWRLCCFVPSNLLLLDEPTNHLVITPPKDVLKQALAD